MNSAILAIVFTATALILNFFFGHIDKNLFLIVIGITCVVSLLAASVAILTYKFKKSDEYSVREGILNEKIRDLNKMIADLKNENINFTENTNKQISILKQNNINSLDEQQKLFTSEFEKFNSQISDCSQCSQVLSTCIRNLDNMLHLFTGKFGADPESIVSLDNLLKIEEEVANNTQILVVTTSIILEKTHLKPIIFKNITKKRVMYRYVIPDSNDSIEEDLIKLFIKGILISVKDDNELIKLLNNDKIKITDEIIKRLNDVLEIYTVPIHYAYMTVLVYNHRNEDVEETSLSENEKQKVLVKLPEFDANKPRNLSFRVPNKEHNVFIKSINTFLGPNSDCQYRNQLNLKDIIHDKEIKVWPV